MVIDQIEIRIDEPGIEEEHIRQLLVLSFGKIGEFEVVPVHIKDNDLLILQLRILLDLSKKVGIVI